MNKLDELNRLNREKQCGWYCANCMVMKHQNPLKNIKPLTRCDLCGRLMVFLDVDLIPVWRE